MLSLARSLAFAPIDIRESAPATACEDAGGQRAPVNARNRGSSCLVSHRGTSFGGETNTSMTYETPGLLTL